MKKKAIILSGNLVQDHEFIYPFYRLQEEGFSVDVCLNEGKPVKGILGIKNMVSLAVCGPMIAAKRPATITKDIAYALYFSFTTSAAANLKKDCAAIYIP